MVSGHNKEDQILDAINKIAGQLLRVEQERNALRREVQELEADNEEFRDMLAEKTAQKIKKYQKEIKDATKEHKRLSEKLAEMENVYSASTAEKTEKLEAALEENLAMQREMRADLQKNAQRQARIEEELINSEQRQIALSRKMEGMAAKYMRMVKKIEQVEQTALAAQTMLEGRNIELLEDYTAEAKSKRGYASNKNGFPAIKSENTIGQESGFPFGKVASYAFVLLMAGTVGLALWKSDYTESLMSKQNANEAVVAYQSALDEPQPLTTAPLNARDMEIDSSVSDFVATADTDMADIEPASGLSAQDEMAIEPVQASVIEPIIVEDAVETVYEPSASADVADSDPSLPTLFVQLEKDAMAGVAEAQHDLATLYSSGQNGVPKSYEKAAYWFRKAADQGIANARYNLGVLYHQGMGVEQDVTAAVYWYRRAAELGHPEAQYNLGIANIEGIGTEYNPKLAVAYFKKAAQENVPEAAYNLGLILENGLLGTVNVDEAAYWYAKSADMGNLSAKSALVTLRETASIPMSQMDEIMAAYNAAYFDDQEELAKIETAAGDSADVDLISTEAENDALTVQTTKLKMSRWERLVKDVQDVLHQMDLYAGAKDGIYGPRTREAIRSYQTLNGLPNTGEPSDSLLAHMETRLSEIEQGSRR